MMVVNFQGQLCPATWRASPTTGRLYFFAPVQPDFWITSNLGWVKQKNDGRWEWTSFNCSFFTPPNPRRVPQGVAATEAAAKLILQTIWETKSC